MIIRFIKNMTGNISVKLTYPFILISWFHNRGYSARLQLAMDNKEDIEGYSMDDSSITRMRKFYNHKKDRTLAAPKENILTTSSTIDNNVRLLLLRVFLK